MEGSRALIVLLLMFSSCAGNYKFGTEDFVITVNTDGTYSVSVQGNVWLKSAPTFFRANKQRCTVADGSLKLLKTTATSGSDVVGTWQSTNFFYEGSTRPFLASIYFYKPNSKIFADTTPFVLFKQTYTDQVNATQGPTFDDVIAGFPGFVVQDAAVPLGYLSYGGDMFGDTSKRLGQFGPGLDLKDGIESGPLAIFDKAATANVLIFSPASSFMSANLWHQKDGSGNNLYWGTMGGISDVTPGFETSTIMYFSKQGINKGFVGWGQILQKWYGRDDTYVKTDFTNNYLGYWTDNGAYYYYKTEEGKNYQDTMLDVAAYIKSTGIPFRYLQFDSWWYFKGIGGGVKTWHERPDVFPNGLEWFYNKTGLVVSAHNRYWASDTTYAKQNGGKYNFIVDALTALPVDQTFWNDLLGESRKWGLVTYEQDWLNVEFLGVKALLYELGLGEQWLNQMGEGAARNDLTIQYCMSLCRQVLHGISIPVVTQARVSDDYHPGKEQWRIGVSSVFARAIGIAPFKDNFWTTTVEPGSPYKGATEPYTELNAVVATLSTGPVGPSDMIGKLNKTVIMRSVNGDGLILKPSRPATAIDDAIRRMALSDFEGPDGEVWSTVSDFGGSYKFGILLAADLQGNASITPAMAGFDNFPTSMVFSAKDPIHALAFDGAHSLQLSGCSKTDFCLYYVTPVFTVNGKQVLIQGELGKWVPMSPQRVVDISMDGTDIVLDIVGAAMEPINFWFLSEGHAVKVNCILNDAGTAKMSFAKAGCYI